MWSQFYLIQADFAVSILAALTFFGVFWLHFDAWIVRKSPLLSVRTVGFLLLAVSSLVAAVRIETGIIDPIFPESIRHITELILTFTGLLLIIGSVLADPLTKRPITPARTIQPLVLPLTAVLPVTLPAATVAMFALTGFLYLRRATVGLEDHLKPLALSFYLIALSRLILLSELLRTTTVPDIYRLVAPYGALWIAGHIVMAVAIGILFRWVFGYLLKQFGTQLFMIFTIAAAAMFLVTTVLYSALLIRDMERETLSQLATNVRVLSLALEGKHAQSLAAARSLSLNQTVILRLAEGSRQDLAAVASDQILSGNLSSLIIINSSGQVVARGEDRERIGDSLSDDPLVKRAVRGDEVMSSGVSEGVLGQSLVVRSAVPVKSENAVVGIVLSAAELDSAFVDGIKKATGLEASVYGGYRVAATTFTDAAGNRLTGLTASDPAVRESVLKGEVFSGTVTVGSSGFYGAYAPVTDIDGTVVGMLFTGKPQIAVLAAAGRSIEITFLVTVILLTLLTVPAYGIARYITGQLI
ncbi:hypothetical protein A2Z33_00315 [Candidatus Gottesmanbacteria bacterium RBG_16_52_11]|uniref:Single cache domain-containing protein n=1 Tax=Candidatus Gottesmanbacteria bacterium RBG_16_52_11 TaxID=1798374 RepID=A0A1F5YNJ7_9BACT|nr:MAG: hypothetical protein A2Z33_00315 [Candidatus Gottesmanbacteria bacterium RBG_16_52_11]